ncbi:TPA: hypothetical protein HA278_08500 [Candidatus Woesearchaeota archaeon]|jgi:hypothetical protein|nr:hypothetical protein [archaeon]HIJ12071.1 hypothetical protein [Candidatus Woesearchaeota archaeon]|tara:strand:+ start:549 stop:1241 length:693 start_codon:yes stop_codon:yes gene_type:complete
MTKNDVKKLHPADRIKKLKQLEQEKKKEIEEMEKLIEESQQELTSKKEFKEKVPIPQVASRDISALSAEGREILKMHRGISEVGDEDDVEEKIEQEESLEETVFKEAPVVSHDADVRYAIPPDELQRPLNQEYVLSLSYAPIGELRNRLTDIYNQGQTQGYFTQDQQQQTREVLAGLEKKMHSSAYTSVQEAGIQASEIQKIGASMLSKTGYDANAGRTEVRGQDWYKGG